MFIYTNFVYFLSYTDTTVTVVKLLVIVGIGCVFIGVVVGLIICCAVKRIESKKGKAPKYTKYVFYDSVISVICFSDFENDISSSL